MSKNPRKRLKIEIESLSHYADENLEISSDESFGGDDENNCDYDEPNMKFEPVLSTTGVCSLNTLATGKSDSPPTSPLQSKVKKIILTTPTRSVNPESSETNNLSESYSTSLPIDFAIEKLKNDLKHKDEIIKSYEKKEKNNEEQFKNMINSYEKKIKDLNKIIANLNFKISLKDVSFECLKTDDHKVKNLTGLPNFTILNKLFELIKPHLTEHKDESLSKFDSFVLTLTKLRLDLPISYMSYIMGVDVSVMSKLYRENLQVMNWKIGPLVVWPDEKTLLEGTPGYFKAIMRDKCIVLIHFLEILIKNLNTHSNIQYVKHKLRYLIAFTARGEIIFVSKGFGSKASNEDIIKTSGFFDEITENHIVLSVKEMFEEKHKDDQQIQQIKLLAKNTEDKVLDLLKDNFRILFNRQTANSNGEVYSEYTVRCCCALANLQMPEMIDSYAKEVTDAVVVHTQ